MQPLILIILLIVYGGGIWKFWTGYRQTNFTSGFVNKLMLSMLWPVLIIANKSYRRNFQKALKGK